MESTSFDAAIAPAAPVAGFDHGVGRRRVAAPTQSVLERNAWLIFVVGVCAALGAANLRSDLGPDSWYSLVSGRTILRHGLPHHDTLTSLTLGRQWIDQQWLAHLALYGLWTAGGWSLALLVGTALFTASFAVLARGARVRGASQRSVAIVTFGAYLAGLTDSLYRAQILAYLPFALVLALVLADEREPSRRVYLVFAVLVVWANLHGSVLLGAGLVTAYGVVFAGSRLRRRETGRSWLPRAALLVFAPWLAAFASPYALELPRYYRSVLANRELARASSEWSASTLGGQPFFYGLLAAAVVVAVVGRRSLSPFGWALLIGTAVLGVLGIRNIVWFALAALAVLPAALDRAWPAKPKPGRPRLSFVLAAAGLIAAITAFVSGATHPGHWFEEPLGGATAAVARAAAADPSARIFANEEYADRLLFEEPTLQGRIAYDIRYELLTSEQLRQIVAFRKETGPDWQATARPYRLLVLNPHDDAGAVRFLDREPGTTVLFRSPGAVVLQQGSR